MLSVFAASSPSLANQTFWLDDEAFFSSGWLKISAFDGSYGGVGGDFFFKYSLGSQSVSVV